MPKKEQDHYKYNQLISILRQKIFAGEFAYGHQLPPERTLAEMFGFARVTIRTALRELSEDGLIEQRRGVGTFVTHPGRAGEARRVEQRILFFCDPSPAGLPPEADPYTSQLLLGFHKAKDAENLFRLETVVVPSEAPSIPAYAAECGLKPAEWDGVIFQEGSGKLTSGNIDDLIQEKVNFVVLGESENPRYYPVVAVDCYQGAYDLTACLLKRGKRSPFLLFQSPRHLWEKRMAAGFRRACLEAGVAWSDSRIVHDGSTGTAGGGEFVRKLIREKVPFDALVVIQDRQVAGIMTALEESGLRVPEAVDVGLYDGYQWLSLQYPRLPRLAQPFSETGEAAIRILMERRRKPDSGVTIRVIPPRLIVPK